MNATQTNYPLNESVETVGSIDKGKDNFFSHTFSYVSHHLLYHYATFTLLSFLLARKSSFHHTSFTIFYVSYVILFFYIVEGLFPKNCPTPVFFFFLIQIFCSCMTHLKSNFKKHPNPRHVATSAVYVTVILLAFD